jgi:outer membrane immunogenic protein
MPGPFLIAAAYWVTPGNDRDAWTSELSDDLQRGNVNAQKTGFIGGVQGGYNWQTGCTVFGIQADYGWSSINAEVTDRQRLGGDTDTLTVSSRLRGLGTVRARTRRRGRQPPALCHGRRHAAGGVAFADFKRSYSQIDLNTPGTETFETGKSKWGSTLGVGTEWAIWGNWSLQSEVLYAKFEKDETSFTCAVFCGALEQKRFDHHDSVWISKIGLNYRFGGPAVMAKY